VPTGCKLAKPILSEVTRRGERLKLSTWQEMACAWQACILDALQRTNFCSWRHDHPMTMACLIRRRSPPLWAGSGSRHLEIEALAPASD